MTLFRSLASQDGPGMGAPYEARARYRDDWRQLFASGYQQYLYEGITILDVGSGRTPAIPLERRPEKCRYIGLDISEEELALAPAGSYDETYVLDLRVHEPSLDGMIDLAISWQVLEHIQPLGDAVENIRCYLKIGGHFVALLSGKNAHFSWLNRIVPEKLGAAAMERLLKRPPDTVFKAHYDRCTYAGLKEIFRSWSSVDIRPHYRGGIYFRFSKLLLSTYLAYEDWIARNHKKNLATHYTVVAEK